MHLRARAGILTLDAGDLGEALSSATYLALTVNVIWLVIVIVVGVHVGKIALKEKAADKAAKKAAKAAKKAAKLAQTEEAKTGGTVTLGEVEMAVFGQDGPISPNATQAEAGLSAISVDVSKNESTLRAKSNWKKAKQGVVIPQRVIAGFQNSTVLSPLSPRKDAKPLSIHDF